jgi:hypothetical protein
MIGGAAPPWFPGEYGESQAFVMGERIGCRPVNGTGEQAGAAEEQQNACESVRF